MVIVFQNIEGEFFSCYEKSEIFLPAGKYRLHYWKLTDAEWEDGESFDNLTPDFFGDIEKEDEFSILKVGAKVEFWCSRCNEYDRCDPYIQKYKVIVT